MLGRLGQDASKSKSKKSPAWVLEDADDDDIKVARAFLADVDPFGKSKAAGGKDKGGKKGKKK